MSLKRPGFTLIELTLVAIIILALVALSVPIFRKTFSGFAAKDAAFNVAKLSSYAQEKAVIDKKNYRLVIDPSSRTYRLSESYMSEDKLSYRPVKGRFGNPFVLPQGLMIRDPKLYEDINKPGPKMQATFYPDGHCDQFSINIVDSSGNGFNVAVKNSGSFAKVKEVPGAK